MFFVAKKLSALMEHCLIDTPLPKNSTNQKHAKKMSEQFGRETSGFPTPIPVRKTYRKSEAQRAKENFKKSEAQRATEDGNKPRSNKEHTNKALRKRRINAGLKVDAGAEDGTSWKRLKTGWTTAQRQEKLSPSVSTYYKVTKQIISPAEMIAELIDNLSDVD